MDSSKSGGGDWGSWFRASSDKWLLTFLIIAFMFYNEHILHRSADAAQVQIVNGWVNNVLGGLMVLVTQAVAAAAKAAMATASTREDPRTGATVGTLEIKQGEGEK